MVKDHLIKRLREIGITLFLAAVGMKSGEKFVSILLEGDGLWWLLCGAIITALPLLVVGLVARAWNCFRLLA